MRQENQIFVFCEFIDQSRGSFPIDTKFETNFSPTIEDILKALKTYPNCGSIVLLVELFELEFADLEPSETQKTNTRKLLRDLEKDYGVKITTPSYS